jgi:hypothetical protein
MTVFTPERIANISLVHKDLCELRKIELGSREATELAVRLFLEYRNIDDDDAASKKFSQ